jgi:hypothetical protein
MQTVHGAIWRTPQNAGGDANLVECDRLFLSRPDGGVGGLAALAEKVIAQRKRR